jgi:hypothetical protein
MLAGLVTRAIARPMNLNHFIQGWHLLRKEIERGA